MPNKCRIFKANFEGISINVSPGKGVGLLYLESERMY